MTSSVWIWAFLFPYMEGQGELELGVSLTSGHTVSDKALVKQFLEDRPYYEEDNALVCFTADSFPLPSPEA